MNIKIDWKDYIAWLCLLIKFYHTANNYKSNMDQYLMIDASDKIGNCKRRVLRYIYNALVMELYRELGW
jgi:hypothetical protein